MSTKPEGEGECEVVVDKTSSVKRTISAETRKLYLLLELEMENDKEIDLVTLKEAFKKAILKYHPDKQLSLIHI